MGINNLNKFLRKNCNNVFNEIHISEYAYKKVAIDISLFLCKFKAACGDNWISAFINLISCLRRNEIHCVFIFDNGCPDEKLGEREERKKQQDNMRKKISDLEDSLDEYKKTGFINDLLKELQEKISKDKNNIIQKRLLNSKHSNGINKPPSFDLNLIEEKIKKMRNYILNISKSDFDLAKELFKILNVPFYDAPLEAECACADLCKRGIVDAVLTEDTDVIAYGSNIFLSKIDTSNDTCVQIIYEDVLKSLKLNEKELLDLCIMFGCDYNKNINKVGIETSYKHILKYRSIEEISKQLSIDVSILNYKRTRELFTDYEKLKIENIPFCGVPNFELLENFIAKHQLYSVKNFNKLKECFTKNKNIIIDHEIHETSVKDEEQFVEETSVKDEEQFEEENSVKDEEQCEHDEEENSVKDEEQCEHDEEENSVKDEEQCEENSAKEEAEEAEEEECEEQSEQNAEAEEQSEQNGEEENSMKTNEEEDENEYIIEDDENEFVVEEDLI
jgi:flap endonuclease-1